MPQLGGEIDEQDRILDLDTDQRNETDDGGIADRIAAEEQRDDAAKNAERNDTGHHCNLAEATEFDHQHAQNAEHRDGDDRPQPAETARRDFGLAALVEAIAFGELDRLYRRVNRLVDLCRKETIGNLRRHRNRTLLAFTVDARRRRIKARRGDFAQRNGPGCGGHEHIIQRRNAVAPIKRQAHHDIITVSLTVAQPPASFARQRQSQCPSRGAGRHTEQRRLAGIEAEFKARLIDSHRIGDIAGARHLAHDRFNVAGQVFQHIEIGADNLDQNRCIDRRTVLEHLQDILRIGAVFEAFAQPIHQRRTAHRIPFLQIDQHFADIAALIEIALVIENLRVAAADIRKDIGNVGLPLGCGFDEPHRAFGLGDRSAFGCRDTNKEIGCIGRRKQAGPDERHQRKPREHQHA